ncbi:hypothetical protein BpHYR1_026439 [Brachionus plicatilis]|uniref:Uncharacterized protein n=1 Tax=Brachionus plicatilis TaxID=10195 RepID=A0A3M7S827_BRAPC|nr:hypothetical protein BpHYR1_026439 [Brachionus plicatilis]
MTLFIYKHESLLTSDALWKQLNNELLRKKLLIPIFLSLSLIPFINTSHILNQNPSFNLMRQINC